ncbi:MAG: metallophosphoesterase [Thermoflexales bacterium]|nr:metallophosphoesterase [Thermoflexales bacterium]
MQIVIPSLALVSFSLAAYVAWLWKGQRRSALGFSALLLASGLADGLLIAALPHLGLSFGPVGLPWMAMIVIRSALILAPAILWRRTPSARPGEMIAFVAALNVAILACEAYGLYVEPFNLSVTQAQLALPASFNPPTKLRIVHLSDLHMERTTQREQAVLDRLSQIEPDLILLTGDYLNLSYVDDPLARAHARDFLRQLHAPYGVYAVSGTVDGGDVMDDLFADIAHITVLSDETARLEVNTHAIYLVGVANLGWARDRRSLQALMDGLPKNSYSILMYHTPDLIETASELGVDLYLAGHTHGGQIRLPWFGAIVTASRYHKQYESGLYQLGPTQLYVSRGIGMEGLIAPRARFLCPPEVVEITLASP